MFLSRWSLGWELVLEPPRDLTGAHWLRRLGHLVTHTHTTPSTLGLSYSPDFSGHCGCIVPCPQHRLKMEGLLCSRKDLDQLEGRISSQGVEH